MNKKHTLKKTAALILGLTLTVGATGCNFFPTDSEKDLAQVVATVDISSSLEKHETYDKAVSEAVAQFVADKSLPSTIYKSELVASFLSNGYSYVQSGYSYEDVFNMLMDSLVNQKIMTQYAAAYYLAGDYGLSRDGYAAFVEMETSKDGLSKTEKTLLEAHPEVLALKYFLTEGGKDNEEYLKAEYSLKKSMNTSLDSLETEIIAAEEEAHDHGETRATPTGVGTEKEDFYPVKDGVLDYDIYTGRNTLDACGTYEKVDDSTASTRKKAYNAFLANLQSYNLIDDKENTADITQLDYYYVDLASVLTGALLNKYYEDLQDEALAYLTDEYIADKYDEIKEAQQYSYAENPSAFTTAIGGLSDKSFVLSGEEGFGFVYNILIPFSASQEQAYSAAKNKNLPNDKLFEARAEILADVQAKDLRDSWFSEHDHANYAYEVEGNDYFNNGATKGEKTYLFFEDSVANTERYEALKQYAGKYPYNGTVEKDDHEYTFKANKMDIDGFISEMRNYIEFVSGASVTGAKATEYGKNYLNEKEEVDYSKFVYYTGKVDLGEVKSSDYFNKESLSYKALSAVNELMFAYSTDTGCLNTYMGYAVSPYKTDFVPEFEYAAQYAVQEGVGTYVVCGTDYGWHIVYTSFVYDGGDVYGGYNAAEKEVEGTFSNLFYESLKATAATTHTSEVENNVLNKYNNDDSVTRYTSRYKDLLELDA
ncbi:MAG: hypothetical protein IJX88_02135 [Clostridia bacterium]|nr:hypothetical protein [Clostridia bacterium]